MARKVKEPEQKEVNKAFSPQDDSNLWAKIPSVKDQIETGGFDAFDPILAGKVLGLLAFRCLERGLASKDADVPLYKKMDWSLRIAPVISQLQSGMGIKDRRDVPATEVLVDKETSTRLDKIKKLLAKNVSDPPDVILDTLAPMAATPPEEV